eukprot:scaffold130466_cov72-Phaeocystis_antarctica.AAC.1
MQWCHALDVVKVVGWCALGERLLHTRSVTIPGRDEEQLSRRHLGHRPGRSAGRYHKGQVPLGAHQPAVLRQTDLHSCHTSRCRPWPRRASLLPHFTMLTLGSTVVEVRQEGRAAWPRVASPRLASWSTCQPWPSRPSSLATLHDAALGHAALPSCRTSP